MSESEKFNKDNKAEMEEEFRIINQILSGDTSAFTTLQKKYKKIIVALIRKMIRNEDDVEDLTQETFIKAYNALKSFQFGYAFSAWLYRIASNTCIDFLRKKRFPTISLNQPISDSDDELFFEVEDNTYVPDVNLMNLERKKILDKAINELPENYREIIQLRHEEEMDYNEISKKLDIPLGTVKAHLFRARKILLQSLKNHTHLFEKY